MSEETQDVNTELDTSTNSSATEHSSQTSETSTQRDEKQEPSLQDVIDGVLKKHNLDENSEGKEETTETGDKSRSNSDQHSGQKEEGKDTSSKTQEQQQKDDKSKEQQPQQVEDKELANYPQRAQDRIRGLISERNTLTTQIEQEYKPTVQRMQNIEQFCQKGNISAEDFHLALEMTAALKTNPQEGIKRLEAYITNAKQQLGQLLPPDLQQRVDEGKLSVEDAKEWAKSRLEAQGRKAQSEQMVKQNEQQMQRQLASSLESWKTTKQSTDADFKPKTDPNRADGKFELTMAKFEQLWQKVPVYSVAEAVALMDRAYTEVSNSIKSFLPAPTRRRALSSVKSSNGKQQEETIDTSKPGWARKFVHQRMNGQ